MSQVSQRFYCYCCQVGFSTTSHKCNGKTASERVEKTVPEPFLTIGHLQIATSLKELLMCSKYWSYLCDITFKARYRRRQRPRANEEKSESTLLKSLTTCPPSRICHIQRFLDGAGLKIPAALLTSQQVVC